MLPFQLVKINLATATNQATEENLVLFVTKWSPIFIQLVVKSDSLNVQIMSGIMKIFNKGSQTLNLQFQLLR